MSAPFRQGTHDSTSRPFGDVHHCATNSPAYGFIHSFRESAMHMSSLL